MPSPRKFSPEEIDAAVDGSLLSGSVVYFIIRRGMPGVKIGTTTNLSKRLSELQSSTPDYLFVFGTLPGDKVVEKILHKKFATNRIRGEWYEFTPEMKRFVKKHRFQG